MPMAFRMGESNRSEYRHNCTYLFMFAHLDAASEEAFDHILQSGILLLRDTNPLTDV